MERQYIEEHSVIERYLQGRLAPDEQQAFEEAYVSDPELLEQLELAERLAQGLEALDESGELPRRRRAVWVERFASPQYAAAASLLLGVSLVFSGMLYRENLTLRNAASLGAGAPLTRLQPLITVRGGNDVNSITAAGEGEQIVLLVDPGFGEFTIFRARVSRLEPPEVVTEATGLEAGYEDYLAVAVPGRLLTPGNYEVVVEGATADGSFEQTNLVPFAVDAFVDR